MKKRLDISIIIVILAVSSALVISKYKNSTMMTSNIKSENNRDNIIKNTSIEYGELSESNISEEHREANFDKLPHPKSATQVLGSNNIFYVIYGKFPGTLSIDSTHFSILKSNKLKIKTNTEESNLTLKIMQRYNDKPSVSKEIKLDKPSCEIDVNLDEFEDGLIYFNIEGSSKSGRIKLSSP